MFLIPESQFRVHRTKNKGNGIFVFSAIAPGTVIGDYLGKVIKAGHEKGNKKGLYLLWLNDLATVSPDSKKIGVHLINHSCSPNCAMYPYKGHTLIFATRKIFPGEELTISYLLDPPPDEGPCTDACLCGSSVCQGTMHVSQEVSDKWTNFVVKKQGKYFTQKVSFKFGKELPRLATYPKVVKDHKIYNLFGSEKEAPVVLTKTKLPSLSAIRHLIRSTGRKLAFKKIKLVVLGVLSGLLITQNLN